MSATEATLMFVGGVVVWTAVLVVASFAIEYALDSAGVDGEKQELASGAFVLLYTFVTALLIGVVVL